MQASSCMTFRSFRLKLWSELNFAAEISGEIFSNKFKIGTQTPLQKFTSKNDSTMNKRYYK